MLHLLPTVLGVSTVAFTAAAIHFHLRLSSLKTLLAQAEQKASQDVRDASAETIRAAKEADALVHSGLSKAHSELSQLHSALVSTVETVKADIQQDVIASLRDAAINFEKSIEDHKTELADSIKVQAAQTIKNIEKVATATETAVCVECHSLVARFERSAEGLARCVNCINAPKRK